MAYYRGDYYRGGRAVGDYYRGRGAGDPFWGALLRGIGTVARGVLGIPAAAPTAAAAQSGAGSPAGIAGTMITRPAPTQARFPAIVERGVQTVRQQMGGRVPTTTTALQAELVPTMNGIVVRKKYRRMNAANPKALKRAIRRVSGFGKLCASARTAVGKAATQLQYGRRRGTAIASARAR